MLAWSYLERLTRVRRRQSICGVMRAAWYSCQLHFAGSKSKGQSISRGERRRRIGCLLKGWSAKRSSRIDLLNLDIGSEVVIKTWRIYLVNVAIRGSSQV